MGRHRAQPAPGHTPGGGISRRAHPVWMHGRTPYSPAPLPPLRSSISIAPASNDGARTEPYGGAGRVNMQQLARVRLVLGSGPG